MSTKDLFPDPANIPPHTGGNSDASGRYRDLCSNCKHAEACGGRSGLKHPIFFCEEFDVCVPVPASQLAQAVPMQRPERRNTSERMGLCMNCENAETCTFPKPEGGVWHCEEYR